MIRIKRLSLLIAVLLVFNTSKAQISLKGNVVNERGETVEYVSIGFEADSIGTISDAEGNFVLTFPANRRQDLLFSHVSYQLERIPYAFYAQCEDSLTIVLKDKVVGLEEVVIDKNNQLKTIVGKGLTIPGLVGMSGKGRPDSNEWGVAFQCQHDCRISDILLLVAGCEYSKCLLRMNLYEVHDGKFENILNKPLYHEVSKTDGKRLLDFVPEEAILLKRQKKYFVSVSGVDTYGESGAVYFQAQIRTSYARFLPQGTKKKLPAGPVIVVKVYEVSREKSESLPTE